MSVGSIYKSGTPFLGVAFPYNPADYTCQGTWTVAAFDLNNYVKITAIGNLRLVTVCITGVYAGPGSSFMRITMPFISKNIVQVAAMAYIAGVAEGVTMLVRAGETDIRFARYILGWPAGTIAVYGQIAIYL